MLEVTDNAKRYLQQLMPAHTDEPDACVRLTSKAGQLGLALGKEEKGDQIVEHEGSKVLLVGQELSDQVDGVTLDVQDTPDGPRLAVFREE